MNPKKIGKALLFPPIAIMIILVPVATVLLVGSMVFVGTESVIAYISYVLASYTGDIIAPCFLRLRPSALPPRVCQCWH